MNEYDLSYRKWWVKWERKTYSIFTHTH